MVSVRNLNVTFAAKHGGRHVLSDVSFEVNPGEFVCIVGPSGCGKTTLLRVLAGLVAPVSGEVTIGGDVLDGPHPDVSVVFQDYGRALCPWRTVVRNVELALEAKGVPRSERRERALTALERVQLESHADDHPNQLSGGMQQRLQIARAIACEPPVLLMDEPFASLDALTKFHLEDVTLRLSEQLGQTTVLVTHDLDEAIYLADRVILLNTSPATVAEEVIVELPRPRDQSDTRADPAFVALRHRVFDHIRQIERRSP